METMHVASNRVLRDLFLARLERCAALATAPDELEDSAWPELARRATLSTYRDCVALGAETEARAILGRVLGQRAAA